MRNVVICGKRIVFKCAHNEANIGQPIKKTRPNSFSKWRTTKIVVWKSLSCLAYHHTHNSFQPSLCLSQYTISFVGGSASSQPNFNLLPFASWLFVWIAVRLSAGWICLITAISPKDWTSTERQLSLFINNHFCSHDRVRGKHYHYSHNEHAITAKSTHTSRPSFFLLRLGNHSLIMFVCYLI